MEKDASRPFLVLSDIVQDYGYVDRNEFRMVKCRRQEAFGCGPDGDAIIAGIALFLHLGRDDDPRKSPKLCLSISDEVFERVGSEIDHRKAKLHGRHLRLSARIYTVDGNVLVIRISFIASFGSAHFRSYYLVYDSAAASLFLLPRRPSSCRPACTTTPLKVGEDQYSLVLMADMSENRSREIPRLCLWSPPSPDDTPLDYNRELPWVVKGRVGVNTFPATFNANLVFSFKGNAFWGDLAQGLVYCHCSHLIDGTDPVHFKHIMLPEECRIPIHELNVLDHCNLGVHRTMGCVGDSIWFVIIQPNITCPGDTMVKAWTLDLESKEEKWNLHREFKMLDLFFSAVQGRMSLPQTVPKFPIVRGLQADCALYMLLPEPYAGGTYYGHLVCIDLSSSYEVRLQSNRRMAIPSMSKPVFMDRDFFNPLHLAA